MYWKKQLLDNWDFWEGDDFFMPCLIDTFFENWLPSVPRFRGDEGRICVEIPRAESLDIIRRFQLYPNFVMQKLTIRIILPFFNFFFQWPPISLHFPCTHPGYKNGMC